MAVGLVHCPRYHGSRPPVFAATEARALVLGERRSAFLATLWLAIATVLVNALAPIGSPLAQGAGSAFNPFASDVSLGPKRGAVVRKAAGFASLAADGGPSDDGATAPARLAPASPATLIPPPRRATWVVAPPPAQAGLAASARVRARAPPLA